MKGLPMVCRTAWINLVAALIASAAVAFANSRALERNGNIFILGSDGKQVQLTSSGTDSDPDLSLDGTRVVFVRRASEERSEIWIANPTRGAVEPSPLVKMPLEMNGRVFNQAYSPRFSPDGATIFFLIPYAATTHAIIKVAVAKPNPYFVVAALSFQVVPTGPYKGHLIAEIRKAKLAPGYYEWYWLLAPDGREVGVVGQNEGDVALFMEQQE